MFGLILSCVRDGVVSVRNKLTSDDDSTYYIDTKSIFCLYSLSRIFGKIVLIQQLAWPVFELFILGCITGFFSLLNWRDFKHRLINENMSAIKKNPPPSSVKSRGL